MNHRRRLPLEFTCYTNATLFEIVDQFYDDERNFAQLYSVLYKDPSPKRRRAGGAKTLTLKLIHYAVTTYFGKGAVVLVDGKPVSISSMYNAGLFRYGRVNYDVFRRYNTICYRKHGFVVKTTLAQLLLFRDLIRYNVLPLIRDNASAIRAAMKTDRTCLDDTSASYEQQVAKCRNDSARGCGRGHKHETAVGSIVTFDVAIRMV